MSWQTCFQIDQARLQSFYLFFQLQPVPSGQNISFIPR